jgi:hypothetical protein
MSNQPIVVDPSQVQSIQVDPSQVQAISSQPSAISRFVSNAASGFGVVSQEQGKKFFTHPIDTLEEMGQAQGDLGRRAGKELSSGDIVRGLTHGAEYLIPGLGPVLAHSGDQLESGDTAGGVGTMVGAGANVAAGAGMGKLAPGAVPTEGIGGKPATLGTLPAASPQVADAAHANFMKAIPPTKSAPYTLDDLQTARPLLEDAHADSPLKTPSDVVDAANAGIQRIENHVSRAIENHPGAQLTTDPVAAARNGIAQSDLGVAKPDSVDAGASYLEPYNFDEPKTLAEADRIRRQLNSANRAQDAQTGAQQFDSLNTDPNYAARHYANDEIKNNLYDRLEELGEPGIGDLRATEGSLLKIRNAAQNQIFNGDKTVGGTGSGPIANAGRNLVRATATGAGVLAGEKLGGPWGATAGGIMGAGAGEFINKFAFPSNATRSALIERSFANPVTDGFTLPEIAPRPRIAGLLPASTPELPLPGYTEPKGEPIGTMIGDTAPKFQQPKGWPTQEPAVRLYRGESVPPIAGNNIPSWIRDDPKFQSSQAASGRWFTTNIEDAQHYADEANQGQIRYIDLPQSMAEKFRVSNDPEAVKYSPKARNGEIDEHFLPRELANRALLYEGEPNATANTSPESSPAAIPSQPANGRTNAGAEVHAESQPKLPVASGAPTNVTVPGSGDSYPAQYEVRDLSDIHRFEAKETPKDKLEAKPKTDQQ